MHTRAYTRAHMYSRPRVHTRGHVGAAVTPGVSEMLALLKHSLSPQGHLWQ